jgi:hypothetical protein
MKFEKLKIVLNLILTIGVWVLVLQFAGIIPQHKIPLVRVMGNVSVINTVGVTGSVDVDNTIDVNLSEVVGYGLVCSQQGMYIGVNSTKNTIIPIHWGEISVSR